MKQSNQPSQGISKPVVRDSHWCVANTLAWLIVIFIVSFLSFNNTSATSSSLTVTISDTTVDLNVSPSTNGTFAKSAASTIGISTSNYTGYTLSIAAQNGTGLINNTDSTKILPSIESVITEDQFKALDVTTYNNMWGYLPSKYNSETNADFLPSPTTSGDILDVTSTANSTANEYELTVGARVDTTASLGTYANDFLITVIGNACAYTITYDENTSDAVTNMPDDIDDGSTYAGVVTLDSAVPERDGYGFVGWCTTATADNGTCAGTQYAAGDEYALDQTAAANDIVLYAMWGVKYTVNFYSNPYQVDSTPLLVTFGTGAPNENRAYTKTNSGNALIAYGEKMSVTDISPGDANLYMMPILVSENINAVTYTTSGNYYVTVPSSDSFVYNGTTYYRSSHGAWYYSNPSSIVPAMATKKYSDTTFSEATQQLVIDSKADQTIQTLTYGIAQNLNANPYTRPGYTFMGWSNTPTGDVLYTDEQSVSNLTTSSIDLYAIWSLNDMQTMNNSECTTTQRPLYDSRDLKTYNVRKLGDGRCWMMNNLKITGTLLPIGSNFTGSYVNISVGDLTTGNSYNEPRTHVGIDYNGNTTAWYNYAAATAGTITGDSNTTAATVDICPTGWRLPTKTEIEGIVGPDYVPLFPLGGYYSDGSLQNANTAWWSSEAVDGIRRYTLIGSSSGGTRELELNVWRTDGRFIRCIHNE